MTREEAIFTLQEAVDEAFGAGIEIITRDGCEAIEMAIEALHEHKTGKWEVRLMRHFAHLIICSNCGADINITAEEYLEYYKRNFRYCPYCGAKMEVDE